MKKTVAFLLTLMIVLSCFSFSVSSTKGVKNDLKAVEKNSGLVSLNTEYVEIGKEIVATVNESGEFTYQWFVDNTPIANDGNTFTPTEYDVEKMVTVRVFDAYGAYAGSSSVYISKLPVVYIETENRQAVVTKDECNGQIKIQGNSEFKKSSQLYEGAMKIKCRGNTTFTDAKKPYKLKLGSKADLFGMGKNKHWVLLSNPFDSSYIRNALAYNMAKDMGLDYQDFQSVDVIMNGKYVGNYLLCEHVRIDKTRVDITNWDDVAEEAAKAVYSGNKDVLTKDDRDTLIDDMTANMDWVTDDVVRYKGKKYTVSDYYKAPSIDGGYLICIEKNQKYVSPNGISVGVEKPEGIGKGMYNYIMGYYQAFENALFSDDFYAEYNGERVRYSDLIDVESFAKGFLLNEFASNIDFGYRSTYMYKEIGGLLKFGPAWDFDLSLGTLNVDQTTDTWYADKWKTLQKPILAKLCSDPYFLSEVRNLYWEYRYTVIEDLIKEGGTIDQYVEQVKESAVADKNIWIYNFDNATAVDLLKSWACKRVEWFDTVFASLPTLYNSMSSFFTLKHDVSEYVKAEDHVEKLEIVNMPNKTSYSAGEKVDISGLVLNATFSDGTIKQVEPSGVVTYSKDYIGSPKFYSGVVTDEDLNDIYVSVKYKNASVDYKIDVSPKQDYNRVEQLIEKCPYIDGFDGKYVQNIIEAKLAYDKLSDDAKSRVSNKERLDAAMNCLDKMAESAESGVLGCYTPHGELNYSLNDIVILAKGNPSSIRWELPDSGSTTTFYPSSVNVRNTRAFGDYYIWTVKSSLRNFNAFSIYNSPSRPTTRYVFNCSEYAEIRRDVKEMTYTSFVNLGDDAVISLNTNSLVRKVIVEENGKVISTCEQTENGIFNVKTPFGSCGEHYLTIKYVSCGNELYYDNIKILVREKAPDVEDISTEYLYGSVTMVNCKDLEDSQKEFVVTVQGRANKIRFIDSSENTITKTRDDEDVEILSYTSDGTRCSPLSKELAYEVWTLTFNIGEGTYTAVSRDPQNGWEPVELGYIFNVVVKRDIPKVQAIYPDEDTVALYQPLNLTVITSKEVTKIQILVDDATEGMTTFASTYYGTVKNDICTYAVYVKLFTAGTHTLKVRIKTADGWEIFDGDVSAVVTAE